MDTKPMPGPAVMITEEQLRARVAELARQISADYAGREIVAICTLGGSSTFFADIMRQVTVPATHLFLGFAGYGKGGTTGEVRFTHDLTEPLEGRHAILFEGTVISGLTPKFVLDSLRLRRPASLKFCSLLIKPRSLKADLPLDYVGFEIDDRFAVGYGMGHHPGHRGLPYIGYVDAGS